MRRFRRCNESAQVETQVRTQVRTQVETAVETAVRTQVETQVRTADTTVRAADMVPGKIYKHTRESGGVYYVRPPSGTVARTIEKLARPVQAMKAPSSDKVVYQAALGEVKGTSVLVRRFLRGTCDGERYEVSELVGVPSDYRFRKVQTKPGYVGLTGL